MNGAALSNFCPFQPSGQKGLTVFHFVLKNGIIGFHIQLSKYFSAKGKLSV